MSRRKSFVFVMIPLLLLLLLISPNAPGAAAAETGYVGSEACKDCHEDRYESYAQGVHGIKADPRSPAAKQGCESCHGPGAAHADAGGGMGVGGIKPLDSKDMPAKKINTVCLECHERFPVRMSRALWKGSVHETRGVACTDCHNVHSGYPKNLAQPIQSKVCTGCHQAVKAELMKSSHHPIREGKMECSDCHNPHGTVADKLIFASSVNEKCFECHTEKRGPFIWEHPPVTENCVTCHTPHGSSHDKLLLAKRPFLCQECHSNSRHPGTLYALRPNQAGQSVYTALNNRAHYRSCSNCHSQVHGSNHPSGKSLAR